MIPKIVHFIWIQGASELPKKYLPNLEAWAFFHPTWTLKVWGLSELLILAARESPEYLALYNKFFANAPRPNLALLSDIFRGMLLDLFGGIYSDVDYIPLRPFDSLATTLESPTVGMVEGGYVNNALILSPRGHVMWKKFRRIVQSNLRKFGWINGVYESLYVMMIAGPFMWQSIGAKALDPGILYHDFEVKMTAEMIETARARTKSYGIHIGDGKWVSRRGLDGFVQDILVGHSKTMNIDTIAKTAGIFGLACLGLADKNPLAIIVAIILEAWFILAPIRRNSTQELLAAVDGAFLHGVSVSGSSGPSDAERK